ncbi:MAG: hypothetical protein HZLCBSQH_000100 [Candidatus Fervidibacterota bacterium]
MPERAWLTEWLRRWQTLSPEQRQGILEAFVLMSALVGGKLAGIIVLGWLKRFGIDDLLRTPFAQTRSRPKEPSDVAGYLCVGTIWAIVLWWLARRHGLTQIAGSWLTLTGRLWFVALSLGAALWLSNWVNQSVASLLQHPAVCERIDAVAPEMRERLSEAVLRTTSGAVTVLLCLLALLASTDLLGMAATAHALQAIWELVLRLAIACFVLAIGWVGLQRLHEVSQMLSDLPRDERSLRLGVMAAAVILALMLLTGGGGTLLALAFFASLVVLLFPLWEYLPDLWAVMLKVHQVQQVMMDGTVMQVRQIGWLVTTLKAGEMELTRRNREVLQAFLQKVS